MTTTHQSAEPPSAIEVAALTKTYPGGIEAVRGIDFDVGAGEVFGLLGPNGAGKSTTIGMLTTTIVPTAGRARLDGHDVASRPAGRPRVSSVVFQEAVVDRGLTGRANLELHARLWGITRGRAPRRGSPSCRGARASRSILDRAVGSYSGGQRRRLEIARALVSRARASCSSTSRPSAWTRASASSCSTRSPALRAREEMTIVLTTHYLEEAQRLCDRVAIIHDGAIVALDTPAALLAGLGDELLELRVDGDVAAALARCAARRRDRDAFAVGSTLTVPLHDATAADAIAARQRRRHRDQRDLTTRDPTLDDVYLQLTGDEPRRRRLTTEKGPTHGHHHRRTHRCRAAAGPPRARTSPAALCARSPRAARR